MKKSTPQRPPNLRRRPLHEEVAESLREMITNETLPEGSHIDESALCKSFGISRTPLREALKVLQAERLVTIETNRGAHVNVIDIEQLSQLFEILAGLERQAAELATERASDSELEQLRLLQQQMNQHYAASDRAAYFSVCQETHLSLIRLAGNQVLLATHQLIVARTRRMRFRAIASVQNWDQSITEHRALTDAVLLRDANKAGAILANHVRRSGQRIVATLQQQAAKPM